MNISALFTVVTDTEMKHRGQCSTLCCYQKTQYIHRFFYILFFQYFNAGYLRLQQSS